MVSPTIIRGVSRTQIIKKVLGEDAKGWLHVVCDLSEVIITIILFVPINDDGVNHNSVVSDDILFRCYLSYH